MRAPYRRRVSALMVAVLIVPTVVSVAVVVLYGAVSARNRSGNLSALSAPAAPVGPQSGYEVELVSLRSAAPLTTRAVTRVTTRIVTTSSFASVHPRASRSTYVGATAAYLQAVAAAKQRQQVAAYLQAVAASRERRQVAAYLQAVAAAKQREEQRQALKALAAAREARLIARAPRANAVSISAPPGRVTPPLVRTVPAPPSGPVAPLPPPPPGAAATAVSWAKQALGKPYVFGGAGPDSFDCSGLTMWAWGHAGVSLPHGSVAQYQQTARVPTNAMLPGDLVFFDNHDGGPQPGHMGLYVGNGQMIVAPHSGTVVSYAPILRKGLMGGGRVH